MFLLLHDANVHLRMDILYLSLVTLFFAFVLLFVALITFKKPMYAGIVDKKSHRSVEILWAIIPLIMLFVMLIPIVSLSLQNGDEQKTQSSSATDGSGEAHD